MTRNPSALPHLGLLLALTWSASGATGAPQPPTPSRAAPSVAAVDAVFKRFDSRATPGCSVAVIDAGKVVLKKSYGMADISLGVPMTSSTSSWIPYSEARVFVALAVAMLARDGRIGLDDPVRRHVAELPAYADAVTVRQLLHHTSGLADYGNLAGPGWEIHDRMPEDEMFRMLARWNKLGFAPGQGKMYSNTDYALLKILVERASQRSLHDYLTDTLLGPLGMTGTRIGTAHDAVWPGHALFHEADGEGYRRVLRYRENPVGEISVTTSLDDLVRWERALDDPALGLRALLAGLEAGGPPHTSDGGKEGHAFGVYRRTHRGVPLLEYHGVGEFAYLVQVPARRLSVATLCNVYEQMWTLGPDVALLYAGGNDAPAAAPPEPAPVNAVETAQASQARISVPPAELRGYAGEYRVENSRITVDVAVVDDRLVLTPRGRPSFAPLLPLGDGRFETTVQGARLELAFADGANGTVLTSRNLDDPSDVRVFKRWTPWRPDAATLRTYPGRYVGDDVELVFHVRVDGDRVLMSSRGFAESPLSPEDRPDLFRLPDAYTARFERDGAGRVVAVVLDSSRVKGMRFVRQ